MSTLISSNLQPDAIAIYNLNVYPRSYLGASIHRLNRSDANSNQRLSAEWVRSDARWHNSNACIQCAVWTGP